jgi:hypothetical protein
MLLARPGLHTWISTHHLQWRLRIEKQTDSKHGSQSRPEIGSFLKLEHITEGSLKVKLPTSEKSAHTALAVKACLLGRKPATLNAQ